MKLRSQRFANAALEGEFQDELAGEKIRLARILVALAVPINLSFIILDLWAIRDALSEVWMLRSVITLALGAVFAATWMPAFPRLYAPLMSAVVLIMAGCICGMIYLAAPTDLAARVYYGGLILVIMGQHSMTYLPTPLAAGNALAITLMYAAIALQDGRLGAGGSPLDIIAHLFFLGATIVIGVVGQSLRDSYARENYLLRHSLKRDVELQEEETRRASFLAEHDPLTGLANRLLLERRLTALLDRARSSRQRVAVMFLDLDDFKPVNDTHGHAVGDRVLKVVAERLLRCVQQNDVVARVGGDEFVIGMLMEHAADASIARAAARVASAVAEGIDVRGATLHLTVCIGVAAHPGDGDDIDTLLRLADQQMYRVKSAGKAGISLTEACGANLQAAQPLSA